MNKIIILALFPLYVLAEKHILIDLSNQKLYAYNDGDIYLSSDISSGKRGYETPSGVFKVIQKDKHHKSSSYPKRKNGKNGGASMPYMIKFTNNGHAIHAGKMPKTPASHGCIRVPYKTAKQLFKWSPMSMKVKVSGDTNHNPRGWEVFIAGETKTKRRKEHYKKPEYKKITYSDGFGSWGSQDEEYIEIGNFDYIDRM